MKKIPERETKVDDDKKSDAKKDTLITEEERSDGVVNLDVYKWFIKLGSLPLFIFLILIAIAATGTT